MPGEAGLPVSNTPGRVFRGTDPRPPPPPLPSPTPTTTRDPPGFRGFYNRWRRSPHSTWKASGKGAPLLPPARVPEGMARMPPCMWGSY